MTASNSIRATIPLKILSTGAAIPARCVTSSELDRRFNKPDGYVQRRSGIEHRFHITDDVSQAQLAAMALSDALQRQQIAPDSIDLLISAAAIGTQALPYTAAHILKVSDLPQNIASFDINNSCVGFMTALEMAACLLNQGVYRRIAIVSADLASRGLNWDDEESALIFGDGAACAIVEKGDGSSGILSFLLETYPEGLDLCEIRAGGTRRNLRVGMEDSDFLFDMKGKQLFRLATTLIESFAERLLQQAGLSMPQVDCVLMHQASHLAIKHICKQLRIRPDQYVDIYRYRGNQVAASIPSVMHEAWTTGQVHAGKPVMLFGTAAGLTLGGMVLLP
ncbi:3-oxoacyl-[acyl-carrier-protein] synthase III C-terminal domain-containing protein [Snodgrassella alvi]|uniref:3-oxoacyl-[acyl-carrier-protein] synthase III C-terminal domain-containing protein n=1 Tax=Snodgrassella alvi TaxID=1196083 RepID=UPI000C1DF603|nr:3-oxoacyl-[acyl-carrier-protein] synthase III C-terminal domain-containing protein [Snodgrassella alvi]PIT50138.1 3-oxoacyl-ACP synthase [Snodgrassella alvi]